MKKRKAEKCAAMDWMKTEKDYIPCSESDKTETVTLMGYLLKVKVPLCAAHRKVFKTWIERNRFAPKF